MRRRRAFLASCVVGALAMGGCGGASSPDERPAADRTPEPGGEGSGADDRADVAPAPGETAAELAVWRGVLRGARLSDDEVRRLHRALLASGTDYTERGLSTFAEWQLAAEVSVAPDGRWRLFVSGARVAAEWELFVDPRTGAVERGTVATVEEAPLPEP